MARLPSPQDLGGIPVSGEMPSGRLGVGQYDVGGVARAGAALSEAGQALGRGVERLGKGGEEFVLEQGRSEYAQAHAEQVTKKIELYSQMERDNDYSTMPDRYAKSINEINNNAASLIKYGPMRERFLLDTKSDVAQFNANVLKHSRNLADKAYDNYDSDKSDELINRAIEAPDEGLRRDAILAHDRLVEDRVRRGRISAEQAASERRDWAQRYATADFIAAKNSGDPQMIETAINRLKVPPNSPEALAGRILEVEGTDANPRSTAAGYGNFTKDSWLDIVRKNRPDLAGKSDAELLALRSDRALGTEMTLANLRDNEQYLRGHGGEVTPASLYLAHFLGPKGATAAVKADPKAPILDVLVDAVGPDMAEKMIRANPEVLGGKTVGTVRQWAASKMGGGDIYEVLHFDPQLRQKLINEGEAALVATKASQDRVARAQTAAQKQASDEASYEIFRDITDGKPVMPATIDNDPRLTPAAKQGLYGMLSKYSGEDDLQSLGRDAWTLFQDIHAGRITDQSQLLDHVGKGLSRSGLDFLRGELSGKRTPEGAAEAEMKQQFLKNAKTQISSEVKEWGVQDPKGEENFLRFLGKFENDFRDGRKAGKSAADLLTPGSPDYVGKSIPQFIRKNSDVLREKQEAAAAAKRFNPDNIQTFAELKAAYDAGQITPAQAREIGIAKGFLRPPVQAPILPLSQ